MATTWQTVRVFISSTFRDMHAERDHLVKVVFPRLRQWCEQRRLHLVDIDLRWGVTKEDADNGKAIEICLREIDGSRPFFLCLLGSRYGWVPVELPPEDMYRFRGLQAETHLSITHLEILHAAYRTVFLESYPLRRRMLADVKRTIWHRFKTDNRVFRYSSDWDPLAENPEDDRLVGRLTALEEFGQRVESDVKRGITEQFAEHLAALDDEPDPLKQERALHEAFIEDRTRVHVPRTDVEQALTEYVQGDQDRPLVLSGPPGSGKSAILAHWVKEHLWGLAHFAESSEQNVPVPLSSANEKTFVVPRFIGASPACID